MRRAAPTLRGLPQYHYACGIERPRPRARREATENYRSIKWDSPKKVENLQSLYDTSPLDMQCLRNNGESLPVSYIKKYEKFESALLNGKHDEHDENLMTNIVHHF